MNGPVRPDTALVISTLLLGMIPLTAWADPTPAPGMAAGPATPDTTGYATLSEADELILEIRTHNRELTDTIIAHGLRGAVFLPLGNIARFLDLPITISDDGHYASGWYLAPQRTLAINLRAGTITRNGREAPLDRGDFAFYDGELWVRADRLADILPIAVATDLRAQNVVITPREVFPFALRAAREAARERLANPGNRTAGPAYPRQDTPWLWYGPPITEIELRAAGSPGIAAHGETDLRAAGDVLMMTGRLFASVSSTDGLVAARAQLGRRDPDARLFGRLRATEFAIGDIATPSLPLGLRGVAGRGFALTNQPLEYASVFDSQDFRGDLPSGFEVELYRNDTLVGSTRDGTNGQYEFLQIPVDFGLNVFRLVFYGPQGQRREEVRRISVGDGRLARGAFVYQVFAAQKDKPLINANLPTFRPTIDYGEWREGVSLQYGLTRRVTVVGSAALFHAAGTSRWLTSAGLRSGVGGFAAKLDAALGTDGASAVELAVAGKVLGASVVGAHAIYGHGFVDEVRSPGSLPLTAMTEFDLSRTLHVASHALPVSLGWLHLDYANGQATDTAALRQTMTLGRVMASNVITYTATAQAGATTTRTTTGVFDLSTFAGRRTQYRTELGYAFGPHPAIIALGGEVTHDFDARTTARASLYQAFTSHQTTFGLAGTRKFGPAALSLDSTYAVPTHNLSFIVRLGFSFGRDPLSGRMFAGRPGLSGSGAAAVRAFTDANGNGRYDRGEPLVGNVGFFTGTQHVTAPDAGPAMLTGIGDGIRSAVRIDSSTLPDIAMAASRPGVELVARAGRIAVVDFAVQQLTDIEGTAIFADSVRQRGVAGLQLQLIDVSGGIAARARSENDGFVLIEQVRPGDYTLQIAPEQARNLNIRLSSERGIHVGNDGKVIRLKIVVAPQTTP